jgi:hypothetical protein
MNEKKLQVEIKSVYGNEKIYPVNEAAKLVATLLRQSSLTQRDVGVLKKLGYTIEVVTTKPKEL